jgi:hypothetical protein
VVVGACALVVETDVGVETDRCVVVVDELDELAQAPRAGAIPTSVNATPKL